MWLNVIIFTSQTLNNRQTLIYTHSRSFKLLITHSESFNLYFLLRKMYRGLDLVFGCGLGCKAAPKDNNVNILFKSSSLNSDAIRSCIAMSHNVIQLYQLCTRWQFMSFFSYRQILSKFKVTDAELCHNCFY